MEMLIMRLSALVLFSVLTSTATVTADEISDPRVVRKMVGDNASFPWRTPWKGTTKILFAPNGKSIIREEQDGKPAYDNPSFYEERATLMQDGVMLKDLSKSDGGLYKTETALLRPEKHTMLFVYAESELKPLIFEGDTPVTPMSALRKTQRKIMIIAQQDLQANITLEFSNGLNSASHVCARSSMCVYDMKDLPWPDSDACNFSVAVDYGFFETQLHFQVGMKPSVGKIRNTGSRDAPGWWLFYMMSAVLLMFN